MQKRSPYRLYQTITHTILIILIAVNTSWFVLSKQSGSLVAMILYSIILFLCWRMLDFRAVIIAGVVGFGVHLYELFFLGITDFQALDNLLFFLNLILPIPLAYFGYRLSQESK